MNIDLGTWKDMLMVLHLDVTTPSNSYLCNYRELATPLTSSDSLIMSGAQAIDPLICSSVQNKFKFTSCLKVDDTEVSNSS